MLPEWEGQPKLGPDHFTEVRPHSLDVYQGSSHNSIPFSRQV